MGFCAQGVEIDWAACKIGEKVYGLERKQIMQSDAVEFLRTSNRSYDVVSCFSLLHHFVMGSAYVSAQEMMRLLDDKTRYVLFLDMGQDHEEWFRDRLRGWNSDFIEEWLKKNTSFKTIHRLGADSDNVPPFENNYGRTLFACTRS
ncbi:hypothetical protein YTPLAS18_18320 [Nitrospira sp.]|nr:hypothetical protein YTPLAS18_18320 [Nitrospira sp.]